MLCHHLDMLLPPVFNVMDFDTSVLPEQTAKQQELALQGVAQMVMNIETQRRQTMTTRSVFRRKFCIFSCFEAKVKD